MLIFWKYLCWILYLHFLRDIEAAEKYSRDFSPNWHCHDSRGLRQIICPQWWTRFDDMPHARPTNI